MIRLRTALYWKCDSRCGMRRRKNYDAGKEHAVYKDKEKGRPIMYTETVGKSAGSKQQRFVLCGA